MPLKRSLSGNKGSQGIHGAPVAVRVVGRVDSRRAGHTDLRPREGRLSFYTYEIALYKNHHSA